ncbi:tetratricopeptide repeat protein [Thermostilla marina]
MSAFHLPAGVVCALCVLVVGGCRLLHRDDEAAKALQFSRQLTQQALIDMQCGNWEEADRQLTEALRQAPNDPEARRYYAAVLWKCGKKREAVAHMERAVRLDPDNAELRVILAQYLIDLGDLREADRHVSQAARIDPNRADVWTTRAMLLDALGRTDDALADLQRAAGIEPENRDILLRIAEVYDALGKNYMALAARQRVARSYRSGEEPPDLLYDLGRTYLACRRYHEAAAHLAKAVERGRDDADTLYLLAAARWAEGDVRGAKWAVDRARAKSPNDERIAQLQQQIAPVLPAGYLQSPPESQRNAVR